MILTCDTTALNKAVQTVQRAIISKPSTPIYSGIHMLAKENSLEIQAMDTNMAIACTIEAEIAEQGEILVSAKHFSELIRKLPDTSVSINQNAVNSTVTICSGKSEFQLRLMNAEEYPPFPNFDGNQSISIEEDIIKDLI